MTSFWRAARTLVKRDEARLTDRIFNIYQRYSVGLVIAKKIMIRFEYLHFSFESHSKSWHMTSIEMLFYVTLCDIPLNWYCYVFVSRKMDFT